MTTIDIPPLGFKVPQSLHDITGQGSSAAGYSAISGFLTCPEYSNLRARGVRRKPSAYAGTYEMDALTFGSFAHAFCAVRVVHGEEFAHDWLRGFKTRGEILESDWLRLSFLFKVYDSLWPLANDPFRYLGVEVEVKTDIKDRLGATLVRTVRYDAVVQYPNGDLYSFERKTAARSGQRALDPYLPQTWVQTMLWNKNESLVAKYGQMKGYIFDHLIKKESPTVDRVGPFHVSKLHQKLALEYMRLPERTGFERNEDGSYPRFLHACFGRWRPCDYTSLCHEDAQGEYQVGDGLSSEEVE